MNITKHIKNSFSSNAIFSPNEVDIINGRVGIIKIHGCLVIGVILYGIDCQGSWDYFHRHDRWWAYPDDIEWVVPMFEHDVVDDFLYLDLVELVLCSLQSLLLPAFFHFEKKSCINLLSGSDRSRCIITRSHQSSFLNHPDMGGSPLPVKKQH